MSASTKKEKTAEDVAALKRYPTAKLLKSKVLSGYQQDFAKVILNEKEYSIKEAKAILDKALKGGI